jgi:hypothetical protein
MPRAGATAHRRAAFPPIRAKSPVSARAHAAARIPIRLRSSGWGRGLLWWSFVALTG